MPAPQQLKSLILILSITLASACSSDPKEPPTSEPKVPSVMEPEPSEPGIQGYWTYSMEDENGVSENFAYIDDSFVITEYLCRFGKPEVLGQANRQIDAELSETIEIFDDLWSERTYEYVDQNLAIHSEYYDDENVLKLTNTTYLEPINELPTTCAIRNFERQISNVQPERAASTSDLVITFDYKYRFILEQPAELVAVIQIENLDEFPVEKRTILDSNPDQSGNIIEGSAMIQINQDDLLNATAVLVSFGIQYSDENFSHIHSNGPIIIKIE